MASYPVGTLRLGVDMHTYKRYSKGWKKVADAFIYAIPIVQAFKAHKRVDVLIDTKDSFFCKGYRTPDGAIKGARITILPDGTVLQGAYSLLSDHLTLHDQHTHGHWDIMYKNPSGTYTYRYSLKKVKQSHQQKYKKVHEFNAIYPTLLYNVTQALSLRQDSMALVLYTLLATYMRVGNKVYFITHGHKGLTTLKKEDVHITGNTVTFCFLGKNGVPHTITKTFPQQYIRWLHMLMRANTEFLFTKNNKAITEKDFAQAFVKYAKQSFYPHIVRSHYATYEVQRFFAQHAKPTKKQIKEVLTSIAQELGHKKYSKKLHDWQSYYTITLSHYIEPRLVKKIQTILHK
ncbi:MAG: hypothetical protein ACMXYC_02460 [Candidatus Woesearchaeota archaeon]